MNGIEVDVYRYVREIKAFMKKHNQYCDKLAKINKNENRFIESLPGNTKHEQFLYYEDRHFDQLKSYEKLRNELKKEFGIYTSIYTCPYYTIVTSVAQLNKIVSKEQPNYKLFKRDIFKWKNKHVQSKYTKHHGICKGLAFCLDDVYICFHDEIEDRDIFEFKVEYYKKEDWLPYKIVTNGKDYL